MTFREAVIELRDWQTEVIVGCNTILSTLLEEEQQELKAAWFARKIHAENTRDRLTKALEIRE